MNKVDLALTAAILGKDQKSHDRLMKVHETLEEKQTEQVAHLTTSKSKSTKWSAIGSKGNNQYESASH